MVVLKFLQPSIEPLKDRFILGRPQVLNGGNVTIALPGRDRRGPI